jgi:hypothetical protein
VFGEPTFADAILDRIVHNAYRLELDGPSMRKIKAAEVESEAPPPAKEAARTVNSPAAKPAKGDRK